jgi:hypothetical protein
MTEQDWLSYSAPEPMFAFLGEKATLRKMRLFAVACCRRVWHLIRDERSCHAVEIAERFADGRANRRERKAAELGAKSARFEGRVTSADNAAMFAVCHSSREGAWMNIAGDTATQAAWAMSPNGEAPDAAEYAAQAAIVRELYGNPFRPCHLDSSGRSPAVVQMARTIYEDRRFEFLPFLADALEEAGCTDASILNHCREPGEHVRGCWLLDLILGKE